MGGAHARCHEWAEPHRAPHDFEPWHRDRARLLRAVAQRALDIVRMRHQRVVTLAQRCDVLFDAIAQFFLRVAPTHARFEFLAEHGAFAVAREGAVNRVQAGRIRVLGLARFARVGDDFCNGFAQRLGAALEQRHGVVVTLGHLAAVEAGQGGDAFVDHHFGQHERFAVAARRAPRLAVDVVESLPDVARHFDVLDLVASDRHLVGVEDQDVGRHQHRVHVEARVDRGVRVFALRGVLVDRGLVRVRAVEQTLRGHAGEHPCEFRDLGNVRLPIERHARGIESAGQPCGRDFQPRTRDAHGIVALDQRVVIGEEEECVVAAAQAGRDRGPDRADVVAEVRRAAGGDAGEVAGGHGS